MWASAFFDDNIKESHTNNKIERFFKTLKSGLPSPPPTIDKSVWHIYHFTINCEKETIITNTRIRSSVKKPLDDILYRIKKNSIF